MSYRFMRILVMFDLPTETAEDRKAYRKFRKGIIKNGFFMMQESTYCKLILNESAKNNAVLALKKIKPAKGLVQVLSVTEKQFQKMEFLVGDGKTDIIDTDERLVIF